MASYGLTPGTLTSYYSNEWNGCAQAAVACVLDFHGVLPPGAAWPTIVDDLYLAYPPDVIGGVGTSPGRTEAMIQHAGLRTRYFNSGMANGYAGHYLEEAIRQGELVICIVDVGKLGGGTLSHYVVVFGYDDGGVWFANSLLPNQDEQYAPWALWKEAWHCWYTPHPQLQYVGIVPY